MNTKDLQALINSETTDTLTINETADISDRSTLNLHSKRIISSADPVFRISGRHWTIQGGHVTASQGTLFDCLSSQSGLSINMFYSGFLKSKPLFQCLGSSACYDTHFIGGEWAKPQGMSTPHILVATSGPFFNNNSWSRCRFQTNGIPQAPCVSLACTLSNNWIYGNAFQNINFEIPNAGAIHLYSCFGHSLQDIQVYDADLFGPITDHLIKLTRSNPQSLRTTQTRLQGYFRLSGLLNESVYDIFAPATDHHPDSLDISSIGGIQGAQVRINVSKSTILVNRTIQSQFVTG